MTILKLSNITAKDNTMVNNETYKNFISKRAALYEKTRIKETLENEITILNRELMDFYTKDSIFRDFTTVSGALFLKNEAFGDVDDVIIFPGSSKITKDFVTLALIEFSIKNDFYTNENTALFKILSNFLEALKTLSYSDKINNSINYLMYSQEKFDELLNILYKFYLRGSQDDLKNLSKQFFIHGLKKLNEVNDGLDIFKDMEAILEEAYEDFVYEKPLSKIEKMVNWVMNVA